MRLEKVGALRVWICSFLFVSASRYQDVGFKMWCIYIGVIFYICHCGEYLVCLYVL